jgi:hypothetical protein
MILADQGGHRAATKLANKMRAVHANPRAWGTALARPYASGRAGLGPHNTRPGRAWAGPKNHASGRAVGPRAVWTYIHPQNFLTRLPLAISYYILLAHLISLYSSISQMYLRSMKKLPIYL